jgi:serine/threonine protein kinase
VVSPERSKQLEKLLEQALNLKPEDRPAFLDQVCSHDPTIRADVEAALRAAGGSSSFLSQPAVAYAAPLLDRLAAAESLPPGTHLGQYRIQGQLGHGGMATVYLAQDPKHHRPIAVKVLRSELGRTIGPERFLREIEVVAHLQHPHILPLIDSGLAEGRLYYVMPFVEGESLRQRLIKEKQLSVVAAVRIAREVAEALDYAHRHGVIHRDIKPENILLADGQAVVADFGIARALSGASNESLTEAGLVLGTPSYMSPEQAIGTERLDGRTDVYSLGCVTYEMLAGQPPFVGPTAESVIHQHLAAQPTLLTALRPGVSPRLTEAIARAMAKAPADRFESAGRFADELGLTGEARPSRPSAPRPRRKWLVLGLIALFALVVGGSLLFRSKPLPLDSSLLAVAPFDVLDSALGLWHEGLVDYLSRNLDGAGSLRTVSPTVVIRRWSGRADAASAQDLGRRTGAGLVVVGQLLGAGDQSVRLRGILVDAGSGRVLGEFDRSDPSGRVDRLSDSLTVDLLRELARTRPGTPVRVASVGTGSLLALKSFLQGEQFFRRAVWDSAIVHYEHAITLDTTFALALWRLAGARGWKGELLGAGNVDPLLVRAGRFNHGLSAHDSLMLTADSLSAAYFDTLDPGYWSHLLRRLSTLEEGARRYPDDPEIWYQLGDARFHDGIAVGSTSQQILSTFDRAIALDSSFGPAYLHPITLALDTRGPDAAKPYIEGYLASASKTEEGEGVRLVASLLAPGGTATLTDTASAETLVGAFYKIAAWADSGETALKLMRRVEQRRGALPASVDTAWLTEVFALELAYRGHLREARAAVGNRFHYVFAELALLGVVPPDTADAVTGRWLERFDDPAVRLGFGDRSKRTLGAVLWWAFQRDTTRLHELVRRAARDSASPPNFYAFSLDQADLGLGRIGLALARRDTAEALRLAMAFPDSLLPRFLPLRLLKLRLLADAGHDEQAAAAFDRMSTTDPDITLTPGLGLAMLTRARVAEKLDDRATATRYYQRVLDLWRHADPELRPFVEEASAGLSRVNEERK